LLPANRWTGLAHYTAINAGAAAPHRGAVVTTSTESHALTLRVDRPDLRPELDPTPLGVARFPLEWVPPSWPAGFLTLVRDDGEVTVVCAESEYVDGWLLGTAPLALERGWRRITFAGPLPWELVGFLADVASRLAGAHIPFTSVSGFTTDHVLVRAAQAELALSVLAGRPPPPQRPGTNP